MSLHAQLSPEAEARVRAQKRNSTISSLLISILMVVLVGLILFLFTIPGFFVLTPTIVTYSAGLDEQDDIQKKEITNQIDRKPSAPSSAMAKVIASTTPSPTAVPVPEMDVPSPSTDFGSGDDFGEGWATSDDSGGGFASIPSSMRKRCSREDRLQRLQANGGTEQCEDAVVAALDWLQTTQNKDGSWCGGNRVAMTGFALLTYLGHCETPLSEKYADTVLGAMNYLIKVSEDQKGKLADDIRNKHWPYEHAIATYAIAEAYTFCNQLNISIPGLETAVQVAGQWIIDNQHPSGSWDYAYNESKEGRKGDNSIGAWHVQALKACKTTGIEFSNMRKCAKDALDYVASCQNSNGAIGYSSSNIREPYGSLAGAGALCFQMWDKSSHSVPRKACDYISEEVPFAWNTADSDLYSLYYNAQAMINRGGTKWTKYNSMFMPEILANQDKNGAWKDVGSKAPGGKIIAVAPTFKGSGDVAIHYRTCLAALTLEVYYRFLPGTGQKTN